MGDNIETNPTELGCKWLLFSSDERYDEVWDFRKWDISR
jgi:hypothetical protein